MFLNRRKNTQVALHTAIVEIANVTGDHLDQFLLAGKTLSIIALALQNAPEPFHRSIVNALGHTGHTLCHPSKWSKDEKLKLVKIHLENPKID